MKDGWYVMYTKPKHEKKIAERLKYFNIECFLPLIKTFKEYNERKKIISIPLFPSYLFTKLDNPKSYFESLSIPGVLNYVKNCNQIAKINQYIIDRLKNSVISIADNMLVTSEQLKTGTMLNIQSGPFRGNMCEVVQYRGRAKILVRVEILRRNVLVDLPSNCLIPRTSNETLILVEP